MTCANAPIELKPLSDIGIDSEMQFHATRRSSIAVTVMVFTLNEECHLPMCLASLDWCDDIIVIDSYSDDRTTEIARVAGARFYQNHFDGFGSQRNWALDNCEPKHDWILILDADERVPPELASELATITAAPPNDVGAFMVRRRFHMWGRWLRYSSLYPNWVVRFVHRRRVRYANRGHAETQEVNGATRALVHDLIDENFKGMDEWFARQNRYTTKDAEFELAQERQGTGIAQAFSRDPLQRRACIKRLAMRIPCRPILYFLYSYIWRRGFLDGADGMQFCLMKSLYQRMVLIKKYDISMRERLR